jgi:hypothetical protein
MVTTLPRQLDDDYSFNVHLKRNLIHKSRYLQGCIKKATVKRWLEHLIQNPLYKRYNIEIDPTFLNVNKVPVGTCELHEINQHSSDIDCLLAQQHTVLWKEVKYLEISPGQNKRPLSIICEEHAEELSFRNIHLEQGRNFKNKMKVLAFLMAINDIGREG